MSLFADDRTLLKRLSGVSLGVVCLSSTLLISFGQKPKELFSDKHQQAAERDRLAGFTSAGRWFIW